jgi:release factor glutamine methyltransferase
MKMRETIAQVQLRARKALIAADCDGSALDARLLLQAATGFSHEELVAESYSEISDDVLNRFEVLLKRRLAHEPVSRILGTREFYGRNFSVTPDVLDPRADTEAVIDLALVKIKREKIRLLDIGTGSGALAITLLCQWPNASAVAVDVSPAALQVAARNAAALGVADRLNLHHGSWFDGVSGIFDLIISNPPYIAEADIALLGEEVKLYDPHLALNGGPDGLLPYRAIAQSAIAFLAESGIIIVEIGAGQAFDIAAIFKTQNFVLVEQRVDLGGHVRALAFARR